MRKTVLILVISLFVGSYLFAQEKSRGVFLGGRVGVGLVGNMSKLNSDLRLINPEFKAMNNITSDFSLTAGYYFLEKYSIRYDLCFGSMFPVTMDKQFSEMDNTSIGLSGGYSFLRLNRSDFEISLGLRFDGAKFLHSWEDILGNTNLLALNTMNIIMPIGLNWWFYPNNSPGYGSKAIGLSISYNYMIKKGETYYRGLINKAQYSGFAGNSLIIGLGFRL